jgi:RimJ/RimL family protein N-acetyltransferase
MMHKLPAQLETERLIIRWFRPDDWQDLYEYLSQPETVKYEPYEFFSLDMARQEAVRRSADESFYAVCLKKGGKVIGNIYLARRDFDTWEIGFVFNSNFGSNFGCNGYATEAAKALVDKLFSESSAHRVFAECNPENGQYWKLLERLRFRREGHLLRNIHFKRDSAGNPLWQDTYIYGILDSEWKNI